MISRREWRSVILYALLLVTMTTIPYLFAASLQNDETHFSGFLLGLEDGNSYLGKMRIGARGEWNFAIFYTSEVHDSAPLTFLPYIIPGQIVGLFIAHDSPALTPALILTFHIMRIAVDVLLVLVTYRFIAEFLRAPGTRFTALLFATLGGGFGWMLLLAGGLPPEWFIPEGFSFLILYYLPHIALARATLLWSLLALIWLLKREPVGAQRAVPLRKNQIPLQLTAAACWMITAFSVPFFLVIVYCILGAWGLAAWIRTRSFPTRLFWLVVPPAALTLPLFAYYAFTFTRNAVFSQWTAQNTLPSPSPIDYLLAYAVIGGLAFVGGRWAWRRKRLTVPYMLLIGWVLIVPILVYLPFIMVQRRMAEAVIVPLAILAAAGLRLVARHWKAWRRWRMAVIATMIPAYVFLLVVGMASSLQRSAPVFQPTAEIETLNWLNTQLTPGDVVLADYSTGNVVAAYTDARVFAGHGPETLFGPDKRRDIQRFFAGELTLDELQALYSENYTLQPVRYIVFGPVERRAAAGSEAWRSGLTRIYAEGEYEIYEVP
ncbi:MAG: hypothetical protein U0694_19015 [Anaerolineae bacterium]